MFRTATVCLMLLGSGCGGSEGSAAAPPEPLTGSWRFAYSMPIPDPAGPALEPHRWVEELFRVEVSDPLGFLLDTWMQSLLPGPLSDFVAAWNASRLSPPQMRWVGDLEIATGDGGAVASERWTEAVVEGSCPEGPYPLSLAPAEVASLLERPAGGAVYPFEVASHDDRLTVKVRRSLGWDEEALRRLRLSAATACATEAKASDFGSFLETHLPCSELADGIGLVQRLCEEGRQRLKVWLQQPEGDVDLELGLTGSGYGDRPASVEGEDGGGLWIDDGTGPMEGSFVWRRREAVD